MTMTMTPRDFTNLDIKRAVGGELHWPSNQPIRSAALWRFTQLRLAEMFGADQVLDASLIGAYADPQTRAQMDAGSASYSAWASRQVAAGKSMTDHALKRAAGREART